MRDVPTRHYNALEPAERFRLAMRASARDDEVELYRLHETAPIKCYRASELAFHDRIAAARLLAALAVGELAVRSAGARALMAVAEVAGCFLGIGAEAGVEYERRRPASDEERAELQALDEERFLEPIFEEAIADGFAAAAAVWHAFDGLCRDELGLDGMTVIGGAYGGAFLEGWRAELERLTATKAPGAQVAEWRAVFGKGWQFPVE